MNIIGSSARFRLVYELGNAFAARTALDELLPFVVAKCREALESEGVSILLLDAEHKELYFAYSSGHDPSIDQRLASVKFSADRGVAGAVLKSGVSERIDDVRSDPRHYHEVDRLLGNTTRSMVAAPLIAAETPLGVIEAVNRLDGKPFTLDDQWLLEALARSVSVAIDNATRFGQLQMSEQQLRMQVSALRCDLARHDLFDEIVANSPSMLRLLSLVERAAASMITVLIEGESGTGKELIARAIHRASARVDQPFLAVNCAALPETLIESELFGHRRGAFTGATEDQPGFFKAADKGVLLLDEIGDLPHAMQAKLLRVLQEGEVIAVGATRPQKVDVRIIAATNRNLKEAVENGSFRQDLYYRLAVFPLHLPALRERREDIPALSARFVQVAAKRNCKVIKGLTADAIVLLSKFDWPGNVRQLQNEIERAVVLTDDNECVTADNLSPELKNSFARPAECGTPSQNAARSLEREASIGIESTLRHRDANTLREAHEAFDRRFVCETLASHRGNISHAAVALGISRVALQKKMRRYGLR
jgi:transcriptional regulator with GAF, ATPase, and Fis domain